MRRGVVSIIIPTYNRGPLLDETLASIVAQTYPHWEAIVIEDGSTDDTAMRMQRWLTDTRIQYIPRDPATPGGGCAARNQGIAIARGEWIIFLDADDILSPQCLQQRTDILRQRPELDFLVTNGFVFKQSPGDTPLLWNADTNEPDIDRYLRKDIPWQTTGATLTQNAIKKIGAWDELARSGQDWDYYLRAIINGCNYARAGAPDFYWRAPDESRDSIGGQSRSAEHLKHRKVMIERIHNLLRDRKMLTLRRKTLLVGQLTLVAKQLVHAGDRTAAMETWQTAKRLGLVTNKQYLEYRLYLRFRHRLGDRLKPRLDQWPSGSFITMSGTHTRTPVDRDDKPEVSVVMAVYNGKDYLRRSIDTILAQSFGDFEFIIIDDGSTDGATDILREYAAGDPRIKLVIRPNKGLTASLNEGLHLACGTYIARFDGDDLADPQRLYKQVMFMRQHPQVVLLGGAHEFIDQHDRLLTILRPPTDNANLQEQCLDGTTPICHPLAMYRRDAALKIGGYDESYLVAQDLDFWLRLGEVGELACLPDVILKYRLHDKSVSEKKQAMQVANMKRACETAWVRRGITDRQFKGAAGWRAQDDADTKLRQTLKFGWWAWNSGQRATARSYGWAAVKSAPTKLAAWKLLLIPMLKAAPKPAGGAS